MKGTFLLGNQEDFTIVKVVNKQVDMMCEIDENTQETRDTRGQKKITVFDAIQGIEWH